MKKTSFKFFIEYHKKREELLSFLKFVYVTHLIPWCHNSILNRKVVLYRDLFEWVKLFDFTIFVRSVYYGWRFVWRVVFYLTVTDRFEAKYYDGDDAKFKRDLFNRDMYRLLKRLVKLPKRTYYRVKKFVLNFNAREYVEFLKDRYSSRFRRHLIVYKELKFMFLYESWFVRFWWYHFFWGSLLKNKKQLSDKLAALKINYPDYRAELYAKYLVKQQEEIGYYSDQIDGIKLKWDRVRAYYKLPLDLLQKWRPDVPKEYFVDKEVSMRERFEEFIKKERINNKLRVRDKYVKFEEIREARAKETIFNDFETKKKIAKQPRNVVS